MILYQQIFQELKKCNVRYLVAGGFAVNFHNVQRATVDLDLIIHLERENILRFVEMMTSFGFLPRVPVDPKQFADPTIRSEWITEKGMMVLTFFNPKNVLEIVDVFVQEPQPFEELESRGIQVSAFGVTIEVVGREDLIAMKRLAGRDKDLFDILQLERVK